MLFAVETILLCFFFLIICLLGTGTDEKNVKSLASYPDAVQEKIKNDPILGAKVKIRSPAAVFASNLLMYSVLLLVLCFFIRKEDFLPNFLTVLLMGEILNAFDFFVIDLLWWRHTKRVRFSGTENQPELYRDPKKHFISFLKGIVLFCFTALIDGLILSVRIGF